MTDKPDPGASLRAGLNAPDAPGAERRARRIADSFRPDARMEHLLTLRDSRDPRWVDAGRGAQLAAAMYEQQRRVATDHGINTTTTA